MGGVFVFLLITIFSLALDTGRASAHAFLLRTDPSDGSVLPAAPEQIRFWFSESIDLNLTSITLQDGAGKTWPLRPHPDLSDRSAVAVYPPDLPANSYRVVWRTVSDEDLHIVSGSIVFGIQQSVKREGSLTAEDSTPLREVVFHWISLLSFATLLGIWIILRFLFPSVRRKLPEGQMRILSALQSKMVWLALWACLFAFFAGLLNLWEKSIRLQGGTGSGPNIGWKWITGLVRIVYIQRELAGEICLLIIAIFLIAFLRQARTVQREIPQPANARIMYTLVFSSAILWIGLQAINSHASAFNVFSPMRVIAYALHLLGAGMWIGGQVALIFLIAPRLWARNEGYTLARAVYAQFGYIAAVGVTILIITGIYSGGQQVASLDALLLTSYGQSLVFKSLLVILTGLIGSWHASLFHPRVARLLFRIFPQNFVRLVFGRANPQVTLRLQLLGGVGIFLLAAFLGSTPPARGPQFDVPVQSPVAATSGPASWTGPADDLLIHFSIKPNRPGPNFVNIGVFDTRRPSPGPVKDVVVSFLPPQGTDAIQIRVPPSDTGGNYQISTDAINSSGNWKMKVVVHRAELNDAVLEIPWSVLPAAPIVVSRPPLISNRPLAPVLSLTSLLLLALCAGAWLAIVLWPGTFRGRKSQPIVLQKK